MGTLATSASLTSGARRTLEDRRGPTAATRRPRPTVSLWLVVCLLAASFSWAHALSPDIEKTLETSQYVYIASNRKDGSFGKPAEIWFMFHGGAVYVVTSKDSWRAKRLRWGRPKAQIAAGTKDGARFLATGSFVTDPKLYEQLYRAYAHKYPDGWPKWEQRFREGLADGTRVMIRYEPVD